MIGRRLLGALLLVLGLGGAMDSAQSERQELAGSVVTYTWHSAPMAPVYRWVYVVKVGPGGAGSLKYEFGPSDGGEGKTATFQASAADYGRMLDAMVQAKVLDSGWTASKNRLMGASKESLEIAVGSGKSVTIDSGLEPEGAGRFKAVVAAVRGAVPKEVWVGMEAEQKAYAGGHQ
jgi:hypothetical protein